MRAFVDIFYDNGALNFFKKFRGNDIVIDFFLGFLVTKNVLFSGPSFVLFSGPLVSFK